MKLMLVSLFIIFFANISSAKSSYYNFDYGSTKPKTIGKIRTKDQRNVDLVAVRVRDLDDPGKLVFQLGIKEDIKIDKKTSRRNGQSTKRGHRYYVDSKKQYTEAELKALLYRGGTIDSTLLNGDSARSFPVSTEYSTMNSWEKIQSDLQFTDSDIKKDKKRATKFSVIKKQLDHEMEVIRRDGHDKAVSMSDLSEEEKLQRGKDFNEAYISYLKRVDKLKLAKAIAYVKTAKLDEIFKNIKCDWVNPESSTFTMKSGFRKKKHKLCTGKIKCEAAPAEVIPSVSALSKKSNTKSISKDVSYMKKALKEVYEIDGEKIVFETRSSGVACTTKKDKCADAMTCLKDEGILNFKKLTGKDILSTAKDNTVIINDGKNMTPAGGSR